MDNGTKVRGLRDRFELRLKLDAEAGMFNVVSSHGNTAGDKEGLWTRVR